MRRMTSMTLVLLLLAASAAAQERPAPAIDIAAGTYFFADDGIVSEQFLGGAARFYLRPRVSLGPEVVFIAGESHSHFVLTGNVMFDLLRPTGGRSRAVTPYVVIGGGLYRTNEEFSSSSFASSEGAFTAGGGVRARVSDRVFLGAEARMGWEPHIRLNAVLGVRIGE